MSTKTSTESELKRRKVSIQKSIKLKETEISNLRNAMQEVDHSLSVLRGERISKNADIIANFFKTNRKKLIGQGVRFKGAKYEQPIKSITANGAYVNGNYSRNAVDISGMSILRDWIPANKSKT